MSWLQELLIIMYAIATEGKHDFMYINLVGEDGPAFFKGFDHRMIYNE